MSLGTRAFSFTWKITLGLVAMILVLGLLIVGGVYRLARGAVQHQLEQRALAIATNLSDDAAAHVVRKNVLELYGLLGKYALLEGVDYAFIADADGSVMAHTVGNVPAEATESKSAESRRQPQIHALQINGKVVYDAAVPILGGQVGNVHLGMQGDFVEREIRRAVLPIIGTIAVILLGGMLLAPLLVWALTRPIRDLRRVAVGLSTGDLETPVYIRPGSHDEVSDLARSLERMRSSLRAAMSRQLGS